MSASKNLEYEKTSFLNKSNSAFIERMYLKFVNRDADLPESWKDYFEGIGDELNVIAKEINGPSWGPKKNKIDIDELQKKIDQKPRYMEGHCGSIIDNILETRKLQAALLYQVAKEDKKGTWSLLLEWDTGTLRGFQTILSNNKILF